ncbi:glutamate receptor U1-like [Oratosquilla oratoria]|uniref:glutamate receptor U1-like n=1 Tax=Oratosquilla oratoria TaxID=337810 RepID=UPI003F7763CD
MITHLASKFNFTYTLIYTPDGIWGSRLPNGSFNGMVGMVNKSEVDITMATFTITYARQTAIDFTPQFFSEPTTVLIRSPKESVNVLAFLLPFTWQPVLVMPMEAHSDNPSTRCSLRLLCFRDCRYNILRTSNCFLEIILRRCDTLCMNIVETEPTRFLHGVWWVFCIIIIYSYTGSLIAFLAVPRMERTIQNLEELSLQSKILWTYTKGTAQYDLFRVGIMYLVFL